MGEEDDGVIFEGEPLDQYLQEIGYNDYETAKRKDMNSKQNYGKHKFSINFKAMWKRIHIKQCFTADWWGIRRLDAATLHEIMEMIMQSKLLSHEDFQLISTLGIQKENGRSLSWQVLPIGGAVGVVSWVLDSPLATVGLPAVLLYAFLRWGVERYRRGWLLTMSSLINALRELHSVSRKVLKYLQENELISRGFMYSVTGSSAECLENSSLPSLARRWHSLPALRRTLALTAEVAARNMAAATRQLLEHYPLRGQLDNQQFYLACQEQELLAGLTDCNNEAGDVPKEIKIELLKMLQNYYLLLQSEFLRRLALTFHPELGRKQVSIDVTLVIELINKTVELTKQLSVEYKIFSNYGISTKVSEEPLEKMKTSKLKYDALYLSVHSATLHLQNILYRTRSVEECLENQESIDVENSDTLPSDLQLAIDDILKELEMCKSCCEEGKSFLNSLANPEDDQMIQTQEEKLNQPVNVNKDVKVVHVGKTDLDPEVEDEVFEAFSTQDYLIDDHIDEFTEYDSKEKDRRKLQKDCSKIMLEELKNVLLDKAREWKEREQKAINKKLQQSPEKPGNESNSLMQNFLETKSGSSAEVNLNEQCSSLELNENVDDNLKEKVSGIESLLLSSEKIDSGINNVANGYVVGMEHNLKVIQDDINLGVEEEPEDSDCTLPLNVTLSKVKVPSPIGLQAVPLSHKFMLKESETFYGTGENSSSEDSGHE